MSSAMFSRCSVSALQIWYLHYISYNSLVDIKAFRAPHVLELWLGLRKRTLPANVFCFEISFVALHFFELMRLKES